MVLYVRTDVWKHQTLSFLRTRRTHTTAEDGIIDDRPSIICPLVWMSSRRIHTDEHMNVIDELTASTRTRLSPSPNYNLRLRTTSSIWIMFGLSSFLTNFERHISKCLPSKASTDGLSEYSIAAAVTLSYITFYTAYDKSKKTLVLKNLTDLVTLNRGVDWTLVECNKALSLAGMTAMLMSFLPRFEKQSRGLLWVSMIMLWTHSAYSMYKFYGYKLSKIMSDKAIKQLSIGFGVAGQLALSAGYAGYISPAALVYSASALSVGHFWTMEVSWTQIPYFLLTITLRFNTCRVRLSIERCPIMLRIF